MTFADYTGKKSIYALDDDNRIGQLFKKNEQIVNLMNEMQELANKCNCKYSGMSNFAELIKQGAFLWQKNVCEMNGGLNDMVRLYK